MAPFSGTPKTQAQSLPRLGRAGLVTEAAAESGPFRLQTSSGPWGWDARPGLAAPRAGRSLFLLCLSPGTSPGRGGARHGLQDHPSPRPVTPSGSQRRRTSAERQASVVATAVLTILSLGSAQSPQSPPPSLPHASRRPAHLAQNH